MRGRSGILFLAILLIGFSLMPALAGAQPGQSDYTFVLGGDGGANPPQIPAGQGAETGILQPDGKVVIASETSGNTPSVVLTRVTADGTLDSTFGTSGELTFDSGCTPFQLVQAPSADDLYLLARCGSSLRVSHISATGSVDSSFAPADISSQQPLGIALQSGSGGAYDVLVGWATSSGNAVSVEAIVGAGTGTPGTLDSSYGTNGVGSVSLDQGAAYTAYGIPNFAVGDDGSVRVAGYEDVAGSTETPVLIGLDASGAPDATLHTDGDPNQGQDGVAVLPANLFGSAGATGEMVAQEPGADGGDTIVEAAYHQTSGPDRTILAAVQPDGAMDTNFGSGGVDLLSTASGSPFGIAIHPGGAIDADTTDGLYRVDPDNSTPYFDQGNAGTIGGGLVEAPAESASDAYVYEVGSDGQSPASVTLNRLMDSRPYTAGPTQLTYTGGLSAPQDGSPVGVSGTWDSGTSSAAPTLHYQWQLCPDQTGNGCSAINGATSSTYTPAHSDVNKYVAVVVSATNSEGTFSVQSDVEQVTAAPPTVGTPGPSLSPSGPVTPGTQLTINDGNWNGTPPISYGHQWYQCPTATTSVSSCTQIANQYGPTYTVSGSDVGKYIVGQVIAQNSVSYDDGVADTAGDQVVAQGTTTTTPTTTTPTTTTPTTTTPTTTTPTTTTPTTGSTSTTGSSTTTAAPAGPPKVSGFDNPVSTLHTAKMPKVLGLSAAAAQQAITSPAPKGAGIFAKVAIKIVITAKVPKVDGKPAEIGTITQQSTPPGTVLNTSTGKTYSVSLVEWGGPPPPPPAKKTASSGSSGSANPYATRCDVKLLDNSKDSALPGMDFEDAYNLIKKQDCPDLNLDIVPSDSATNVTVKKVTDSGGKDRVQVQVPSQPQDYSLTGMVDQGGWGYNLPSLVQENVGGKTQWDLTAGQNNEFGLYVINDAASKRVTGATVVVDAHGAGGGVTVDKTDQNGFVILKVDPTKAGVIHVLMVETDSSGRAIYGEHDIPVVSRHEHSFTTVGGDTWTLRQEEGGNGVYELTANAAAASCDASQSSNLLVQILQSFWPSAAAGLQGWLGNGSCPSQKLVVAGTQDHVEPAEILNGSPGAGVAAVSTTSLPAIGISGGNVASGQAPVIAAGGANAISATSNDGIGSPSGDFATGTMPSGSGTLINAASVIAAGGANVIAAGGANVIAAGGANVIAAGGANVIAAGGANVIAAGGANVIAAGGGNVIAAGGANVIAAGGAN